MAKAAPSVKPSSSVRVVRPVERSRSSTSARDTGTRSKVSDQSGRAARVSREGGDRDLLGRTKSSEPSGNSGLGQRSEQLLQPVRSEVPLAPGESGTNGGGKRGGSSGDGPNRPRGDGGGKPGGDLFDDLSRTNAEARPPVRDKAQEPIAGANGSDTPRPLDARDVKQRVAEAIDSNPYLKHRPEQVREYLKQRIDALPYHDQLEVIQHIDELIKSSGFRRFLRRLDKGKKEEVAQRVEKITARLNEWRDRVLEHLQATQKSPIEGGDHGSQLARGPHEKMEATREPTVADSRTDEERGHLAAAADKGLYDAAMNMRQERVSRRERRLLRFLIGLEIALAAVHMTVPPER